MDSKETFRCPICNADWGNLNPINSYEICSCGMQFGYTDSAKTEEEQKLIHDKWRKIWLANGKQSVTDDMLRQSPEWMEGVSYEFTEQDIQTVLDYLSHHNPENAYRDYAVQLLQQMQDNAFDVANSGVLTEDEIAKAIKKSINS